jgi:acyl-CoA reductase-like NAD-dependent aldehyde dehydrogenase
MCRRVLALICEVSYSFSYVQCHRKDVRNAVEAAVKGQAAWWKLGAHCRSQILYDAAEKLQARREDFIR